MAARTATVLTLLFLSGCVPLERTGGDISPGWMELHQDEWSMQVPADWQPDAVFRPDSPTTLIRISRPSLEELRRMLPPSPSPTFIPLDRTLRPVRVPDPYLTLSVYRSWPKSELARAARVSPSPFDPAHARGIRRRFDPDGSTWWALDIETREYTYSAVVHVDAAHAAALSDTVERVLASARVSGS